MKITQENLDLNEFKQQVILSLQKLSGMSEKQIKSNKFFKNHPITENYLYDISPGMTAKMILDRINIYKEK